ncbi:MAG: hypothetical protein QXY62_06300 [Candidatus Altiarchaeota archaeon]
MKKVVIKYLRCPLCGALRKDYEKIKWGEYELEYVINEIECGGFKGLKNNWHTEEVEESLKSKIYSTLKTKK